MELRVTRARRIFSDGRHNAFTGITRFAEDVLVCFRSGLTHISYDGTVRVIASTDMESWTVVVEKDMPGVDLRDPKIVVLGGRVLLYCGGRTDGEPLRSLVSASDDGRAFGDLVPLVGIPPGEWMWSTKAWGGKLYGAAYRTGREDPCTAVLYCSEDGLAWERLSDFPVPGNEVGLDIDPEGRLWALVREDHYGCIPALCTADPPYTSFTSVTRPAVRLQGPMLKRLEGACVITGRRWDNPGRRNTRTDLFIWEDGHDIEFVRSLPSGGDTSYAGWLDLEPGRAVISYYSSHSHKMDIGWETEAATTDRAHAEHSTPADIFLADVCYR